MHSCEFMGEGFRDTAQHKEHVKRLIDLIVQNDTKSGAVNSVWIAVKKLIDG